MEMDLKPSICDRRKLAVWFAFWGEAKAVPTYQKICARYDDRYDEIMVALCDEIIADGGYERIDPQVVTDALSSLTDGLWLSCLVIRRHSTVRLRLVPYSVTSTRYFRNTTRARWPIEY